MTDERGQSRGRRPGKPSGDRSRGKPPAGGAGRGGASKGGRGRPADARGRGSGVNRRQGDGPPRGRQDRSGRQERAARPESRTETQQRYDGPPIPEEITGKELDRSVLAQLKGLPDKLALRVARHLAAAQQLIDEDPETAYQHTLAARARAARLAVVREAVGESAYAAGHYAEALAELRAAKRMNGATAYLPIMADCQRALGRPQEALKLAKSPSVAGFSPEAKAEMTLVEAGARRDLGQMDTALRILELSPLQSKSRASWVVRLRYGYADALEAAGRDQEALAWFHRTHAIDADEITDAADRAEQIENRLG
jgi:tetratricopeptide (TPR) repeat protein